VKISRRAFVTLAVAAAALAMVLSASAAGGSLSNGDFESGDFSAWSTAALGGGAWGVYSGTNGPFIGFPVDQPPQGTYAAVTEEESPSAMVLYRTLSLPHKQMRLSFFLYYRNSGDFIADNQEYRVDILRDGASPFSTDPGDVLKRLFITSPGDPTTLAPTWMAFSLDGLKGNVLLRFRVTVCCNELNASVDKVRLTRG
jgi:hypothetical protein